MTQFRSGDRRGHPFNRPTGLEKQRNRVSERLFPCPLLGGGEVNHEGCTQLSREVTNNVEGCAKENCESPWRPCAACVVSSVEYPRLSADHVSGFCGPHTKDGTQIVEEWSQRILLVAAEPMAPAAHRNSGPVPVIRDEIEMAVRHSANGHASEPAREEVPAREVEADLAEEPADLMASSVEEAEVEGNEFANLRKILEMLRESPPPSRQEIARRCGDVSKGWVDQRLMLRNVSPKVAAMMSPRRPREERLSFAKVLRLTKFDHATQERLAKEVLHMSHTDAIEHIRREVSQVVKRPSPRKPQEVAM